MADSNRDGQTSQARVALGLMVAKLISLKWIVVTGECRHFQTWESQIGETGALEQKVRCDVVLSAPWL